MGKSKSPKIEVTFFYMSIHFGICVAADRLKRVFVKEKLAYEGGDTGITAIPIEKSELFGGSKKEGGVEGTITFLPGAPDQILPDILASRLRSGAAGTDVPGYRGICTAFFTGEGTEHGAGGGGSSSSNTPGFLWSANVPYLPTVWIDVERAPIGLTEGIALIPRGPVHVGSWWRIYISENNGEVGYTNFGEMEWRSAPGGPDLVNTYFNLFNFATGGDGSNALGEPMNDSFNGNSANGWGRNSSGGFYGIFKFPLAVSVKELMLQARASGAFQADRVPRSGSMDYSIDNGATWTTAFSFQDEDGWSFGETRTYSFESDLEDEFPDYDANPAHIIYECLTNTDWGMGSPSSLIDVAGFEEVAQLLYDESFGLSMIWTRQAAIHKFIQEVLDHILAVLFVDPATGLLTLKLIRNDYDVGDLAEINESNSTMTSFGRKLWGDIANEIVVTWTNPDSEKDETVIAQDLASITIQGGIVSDSRNYYGVRKAWLAMQLAQRDLRTSGSPLAALEVEVDRSMWELRPASVLLANYPEHGLDGVVVRVTNINYGKPGDPKIKLSLLEDVFGLDAGDYTTPPTTGWENPSADPAATEFERIFTLPLFFAANSSVSAFVDTPEYPEVLAGVLASTSGADTSSIELWDELPLPDASLEWQLINSLSVIGRATLITGIVAEAVTTIAALADFIGNTGLVQGGFIIIGDVDDDEQEIALITDVGVDFTVNRGVLDTVPRAWPAGTPVYCVNSDSTIEDLEVRSAGETVSYKLLPRTSQGLYPLASAALVSETLTERPWLPNRPANIEIDGVMFNDIATPVDMIDRPDPWVTTTWSERNRLLEDSVVLSWTDATVTPETGQTTKIEVLTSDGALVLATHDGLTGTTFDVPDASFAGENIVIFRYSSERTDGLGTLPSLQAFDLFVQIAPSRLTEFSDARLTEGGVRREMED